MNIAIISHSAGGGGAERVAVNLAKIISGIWGLKYDFIRIPIHYISKDLFKPTIKELCRIIPQGIYFKKFFIAN